MRTNLGVSVAANCDVIEGLGGLGGWGKRTLSLWPTVRWQRGTVTAIYGCRSCWWVAYIACCFHVLQVSDLVMLTRSDEDDLKVKALEYAAQPGQRVWVKVRRLAVTELCVVMVCV
jgi:hypothetical protein